MISYEETQWTDAEPQNDGIISRNAQWAFWRSWKRRSRLIRSFFEQPDMVYIHNAI